MESSSTPQMFTNPQRFSIDGNPTFIAAHTVTYSRNEGGFQTQTQSQLNVPPGYQEGMSHCPTSTSFFTGRKETLTVMENYFVNGPMSKEMNQRKIFLLYGLGGTGKTQCALEFIRKYNQKFTKTYFIHSSSEELIKASYYDIAKSNGVINPTWKSGLNWLHDQREEWSILFDNADDPDLPLGQFLPSSNHGNVIITSRNPGLAQLATHCQELGDMQPNDAVELLIKHAIKQEASGKAKEMVEAIAKELHYFALAIVQAGAYIYQQKFLSTYLDRLRDQRKELLERDLFQQSDTYRLTVYATWNLSWQKLDEASKKFLKLCSQFHHEEISRIIFQRAVWYMEKVDEPLGKAQAITEARLFLQDLQLEQWNDIIFDAIIAQISSYSFFQVHDEGKYSVHPLVHQWIQDTLVQDKKTVLFQAQGIMTASLQYLSWENIGFAHMAALHCIHGNLFYDGEYSVKLAGGYLWYWISNYNEALELWKPILDDMKQVLGTEHPRTLIHMQNLGSIYVGLGRYNEALTLEEPLVDISRRILGTEHPNTLSRIQNLGLTYSELGRYNEALTLENPLVDLSRMVLGIEHPDTLSRIAHLGATYSLLGRYNEALILEESLVDISTRVLGTEHPNTLFGIQILGVIYSQLGRYKEALTLEEPLVDIFRRVLGTEHPKTLSIVQNLAARYSRLGRYNEALTLQEPLVDISSRVLGNEHPDTLSKIQSLSGTYSQLGRYREALTLEEPLVAISKRVLGAEHPHTLSSIENLGLTYCQLGRYNEALTLEEPLLDISRRVLGTEHPHTLSRILNLGFTYANLDRYHGALNLLHPLPDTYQKVLSANHPETLDAIRYLAWAYSQSSQYSKALSLQESLLQTYRQHFGEDHPSSLSVIQDLSETYFHLGRYHDALTLQRPLLDISQHKLGHEHPDTIARMYNLGKTLYHLGDHNEALQLLEPAVMKSKQVLGASHPDSLGHHRYLDKIQEELWHKAKGPNKLKSALQKLIQLRKTSKKK